MRRKLSVLLLAVLTALALSACVAVSFEIGFVVDGELYDTVSTSGSEVIKIPEDPVKDGYTFEGWYWDNGSFEKPFTANSLLNEPLTSDMKVYAKLTENEPPHVHSYIGGYEWDGEGHWQACECGDTAEPAEHVYENETVIVYPTPAADGTKKCRCVCGAERSGSVSYNGPTETEWEELFAFENVRIDVTERSYGMTYERAFIVDGAMVLEIVDGEESYAYYSVLEEFDFSPYYNSFSQMSDSEFFADSIEVEEGVAYEDVRLELVDGLIFRLSYTFKVFGVAIETSCAFTDWGECEVAPPTITAEKLAAALASEKFVNFTAMGFLQEGDDITIDEIVFDRGKYSRRISRYILESDAEPTEEMTYGNVDDIFDLTLGSLLEEIAAIDSDALIYDPDEFGFVYYPTDGGFISADKITIVFDDEMLTYICINRSGNVESWSFLDYGISEPEDDPSEDNESTDPPADDNENTDPPAEDTETTDPPADDNESTDPPADDSENTDPPADDNESTDPPAESVTLTVTVVDQWGNPVENARIRLRCGSDVTTVYEFTDSEGRITVTEMPAGAYEVQIISAPSQYSYDGTYFPVGSDNTVTVTVENTILDAPEKDDNDNLPEEGGDGEPIDETTRAEAMSEEEWRDYFELNGFSLDIWYGTFTSSGYTAKVTRYYDVGTNGIVRDYGDNLSSGIDDLYHYDNVLPLFDFSEHFDSFSYSGGGKYVAKSLDLTDGAGNTVTALSVVVTFSTSLSEITYQLTEGTSGVDYRLTFSNIGGVGEIDLPSPDKKAYNNIASNPYDNLTLEYKVGNDTNYTKYTYLFSGANAMILTDYYDGKYYSGTSELDAWEDTDMNYGAGFLMGVLDALSQIPYSEFVWSLELGGYTYFDDGSIKFNYISFDTFTFRFDGDGNLAYVATDSGIEYYLYDYGTTVVKGSEPTAAEPLTFDELPDSMTTSFNDGSVKIDVDPIGNNKDNVLIFNSVEGDAGNAVSFSVVNCDGADTCFVLDMDMCILSASASNGYLYQITMYDVFMLDILDVDGAPVFRANASKSNANATQIFDSDISKGEWFNLRIEYYVNAVSPTVKVFVNGELVGETDIFFGSDVTGAIPATDYTGVKIFSMRRTTGTLCIDNAVFAISDAKYTESTSPSFAEQ